MTVTEWRTIQAHPDYEVSDTGRIRRLSTGRELKPSQRPDGYKEVNLRGTGGRTRTVHRLVLTAFHGEPQPGQLTRHLDGDPSNNHIDNLAWGSYSENAIDKVRHGREHHANRTHCIHGHEFTPENTYPQTRGGRGCRACRQALDARRRTRGLEPGDPRHGSRNGYNLGCRCPSCRSAATTADRNKRHRRKLRDAQTGAQ